MGLFHFVPSISSLSFLLHVPILILPVVLPYFHGIWTTFSYFYHIKWTWSYTTRIILLTITWRCSSQAAGVLTRDCPTAIRRSAVEWWRRRSWTWRTQSRSTCACRSTPALSTADDTHVTVYSIHLNYSCIEIIESVYSIPTPEQVKYSDLFAVFRYGSRSSAMLIIQIGLGYMWLTLRVKLICLILTVFLIS